jgi:hypothetical protein
VLILANILIDYAKGRWIQLATLPLGTDSLLVVLVQSTSIPTDTTIKRNQFLSGVLSTGTGTGLESTFTNYSRKVVSAGSITITVNTSTDIVTLDIADQSYAAAGGALNNTDAAMLLCYKPTSGSADTAIPVLTKHDCAITTTGGLLTLAVPSIGTAT